MSVSKQVLLKIAPIIPAILVLILTGCDLNDSLDTWEPPLPEGQTFTIAGEVGSVLSGGSLTATGTDGQGTFHTTTDADGTWQICDVPPGTYAVKVGGGVWIDPDGTETENAGTLAARIHVTGDVFDFTVGMQSTLGFCGIIYPEVPVLDTFSMKIKNGDFEKEEGGLDATAVRDWYESQRSHPQVCPMSRPFSIFCQFN